MLHTVWLYLNELKCHKEVTKRLRLNIRLGIKPQKEQFELLFLFYNTADFNFGPLENIPILAHFLGFY